MNALEVELEALARLTGPQLKERWRQRFRSEPPRARSKNFLRRLLAWKVQQSAFGGLSPSAKRRLRRFAAASEKNQSYRARRLFNLKPGVVLTRAWDGRRHDVLVKEHGFEYAGSHYDNLSQIARTITGTRWSGPLFFGLAGSRK